nr:protein arginine N-methyltransferase 1 [Drosophila suzukii]
MTGKKNKKALKTGNKATNAPKKPEKLSLADFHNQLDKQVTQKNGEKMNTNKWKSSGIIGGTRGRGVCCEKLQVVPKYLGDTTVQNAIKSNGDVPKTTSNPAETRKTKGKLEDRKPNGLHKNPDKPNRAGKPRDGEITLLRRANPQDASRGRPTTQVRSCPRIATPPRYVPQELKEVDLMTSADFRYDYGADLKNMRFRQQGQYHMQFFKTVMHQNRNLFKGRVILVLSCGTGTLALMSAQLGARRVYAVDYSKVTGYAELVVRHNCQENVIKVLHGHMKDLQLPEKVDGIVCTWMGHCLLFESEILEVLEARDRWLKKGGFILPDMGSLYIVASEEHNLKNDRCNWWRDIYGFNMNAMRRYSLAEPRYAKTSGEKILTLAHGILSLDLNKAKKEDLFIDRKIRLKVKKEGFLECFLLFFEVQFSSSQFKMSCNPCCKTPYKSLWLQTVLFVEQPFVLRSNLHYTGNLKFKPLKPNNLKEMEIRIDFYEGLEYDDDWELCIRRVAKRWLMLERFQTFSEVESCQDELGEADGQNF